MKTFSANESIQLLKRFYPTASTSKMKKTNSRRQEHPFISLKPVKSFQKTFEALHSVTS